MKFASEILGLTLTMTLVAGGARAQAGDAAKSGAVPISSEAPRPGGGSATTPTQTFRFKYVTDGHESNELVGILRSLLPRGTEIIPDSAQNAVIVSGPGDTLAQAQRIIADLDAPPGATLQVHTFSLGNVTQPNDGNEIYTAIRNIMPPEIKVYYIPSQSIIFLRGTPEEIALAQRMINELDRPKKVYRLTYTITEVDGGKRLGSEHFAMTAENGQRVTLKQGSRVPIVTGALNANSNDATTQFQYVDVGMNFDATLSEVAGGATLKSKVEQSSVAEEKSVVDVREPIIRQTLLEGTSILTMDKPLMLGSLDVPGSTRHLDVEVIVELVK